MKSLLARLFLFLAFAVTAVAGLVIFRHAGVSVLAVVVLTYLCVLVLVLAILINYPRLQHRAFVNDFADELASRNLLTCTEFIADRAFRVAPSSDDGPHYFLELESGGVLHLSGSYLFDYEPIEGSLRHFPCTRFTVRRHSEIGYAVDLLCGDLVIEPEVEAPPYTLQEIEQHRVPLDGTILRDITFDQLLQERLAGLLH
jgi:hypothetical protein